MICQGHGLWVRQPSQPHFRLCSSLSICRPGGQEEAPLQEPLERFQTPVLVVEIPDWLVLHALLHTLVVVQVATFLLVLPLWPSAMSFHLWLEQLPLLVVEQLPPLVLG